VVWEGGLEAFKEKPLLGWGPDNFEQAFQKYFDNRLYQEDYIGEVWFDRAHNVVVDTLVDVGVLGALAMLAVAGAFILIVYRAHKRGVVEEREAMLLYALPFVHFLQLQTGFDTVGSFTLLATFAGYGLFLERKSLAEDIKGATAPRGSSYKLAAGILGMLVLASAYITLAEFNRQSALYQLFVEQNGERQLELAKQATSRLSSFESLRFASASLIKSTLTQLAQGGMRQESMAGTKAQLSVYEERLRHYVLRQPNYYRARMNFAYLLSVETILGENKLDEAKTVVKDAYTLAPMNPLTYAVDALLELYSGNLRAAREKAEAGLALNPKVNMSQEVLQHVVKQSATFPNVSVLRLENL
jgi:hypothetical protein